jgi:hypothetical protein
VLLKRLFDLRRSADECARRLTGLPRHKEGMVPITMMINADVRNGLSLGGATTAPSITNKGATSKSAVGKWTTRGAVGSSPGRAEAESW